MDRRTFCRGVGAAGVASLAGCLSELVDSSPDEPPVVEDRPDAVYYPTHVEGMEMVGMAEVGDVAVALAYSFPHRFWLVTGRERRRVDIESDDSVHLMATVWDPETGTVVPTADLSATITDDGEPVDERSMWPMLSQNMGVHAGDNVPLPGDGTYEVDLRIGAMDARRTGAFSDRFDEPATAAIEFPFEAETRDEIMFELLEDRQGEPGAVEPMEMDMMPVAQLPPTDGFPGDVIGEATSGDGVFVASTLPDPPAGIDEAGTYLAVSARTPYNRYPLPFLSLSAEIERDGASAFAGECRPTFDPELGYHYGAVVDDVTAGDELALTVDAPPQIARHEGYETAFLEMEPMALTV